MRQNNAIFRVTLPLELEYLTVHRYKFIDTFLRKPVGRDLRYFRLHGKPAYNYRYRYSDDDLATLEDAVNNPWPNYVLFNNDSI